MDVGVSIGYWAPLERILLVCLFGDGGVGSDGRHWGASGFKPCPPPLWEASGGVLAALPFALQLCPSTLPPGRPGERNRMDRLMLARPAAISQ